jgi:drug/metabolite transporter (DMT)-like permease
MLTRHNLLKPAHKLALGIVLITSAFLCAAIMSALSKEGAGIPAWLILFLQYAISFIIFVPAALSQRIVRLKTEHLALQIFRSVAGSVCQLLFFVAVRSIPLLVAVLLSNAAPLFIPIVVYIWFRKAVQPLVWISLLIGLFGIVLIIRPGPAMFHNPAALIALAAGFSPHSLWLPPTGLRRRSRRPASSFITSAYQPCS